MSAPIDIRIADYDYPLPDERIAKHPCEPRDACRLLVARQGEGIRHLRFTDLPGQLPQGALMVCNNTRVINARIKMRKATGAEIEIFCLEPWEPADYAQAFQARGRAVWTCMVGNLKRWKSGPLTKECTTADGRPFTLTAELGEPRPGNSHLVTFTWEPADLEFAEVITGAGYIPIPPYLCRASEEVDAVDYQTVYSKIKGSVAAPTAGLHFTDRVLGDLQKAGIERLELTLHVGAGTFQPVKSDTIGGHPMHTETITVTAPLLRTLIEALESGRPIIAVGTTTVRTLESLPFLGLHPQTLHVTQWEPYEGEASAEAQAEASYCSEATAEAPATAEALRQLLQYMEKEGVDQLTASTAIMIAPGYRWRLVSGIVTNFHQPQSTLLLLVASFMQTHGLPQWRALYDEALAHDPADPYRFLSYDDSMLLL